MSLLPLLLVLATAAGGGDKPAPAEQLLVSLRPRAEVKHSPVVLGDVAELHGPKGDVDRFSKLELCPAPAAGKPRLVTAAGIRLAARLAGLAIDAGRIVGATQAEVVASWHELSSDDVAAAAQRWVLSESEQLGDRVLLERVGKPDAVSLLDGAGEPAFQCAFVGKPRGSTQVQIKVTVLQGAAVVGERVATFKVRRFGKQLRLLTNVRRGESIVAAQVIAVEGEWTALQGSPIFDANDLAGRVASHDLTAGTVLVSESLESPVLVERGDTVRLVLRAGALEIVAMGTAQRQGRKGEVIPVLNPSTQKVVQAELVARTGGGEAIAMVR